MENRVKTQQEIEQEISELNEKFGAFLRTKGITAKFKVAFADMAESAHAQHEADKANYEAVKAKSTEENKGFVEFLHTKGIKAKYRLVVENIKNSAKAASHNTAAQIAKIQAQTQAEAAKANALGKPQTAASDISAATLEDEFNAFLKSKGLDGKYTVFVTEA